MQEPIEPVNPNAMQQALRDDTTQQLVAALSSARLALYCDYFLHAAEAASEAAQEFVMALSVMAQSALDERGKLVYNEAKKIDSGVSAQQTDAAIAFIRKRIREQKGLADLDEQNWW
jgi:hypothetical protein